MPLSRRGMPAMKRPARFFLGAVLVSSLLGMEARPESPLVEVTADPAAVRLDGPNASYSILVHGRTAEGRLVDLTPSAKFQALDPRVATVSSTGVVRPAGDGA